MILALSDHECSRFQWDLGRPFMHDLDGNAMQELDSSGNAHRLSVRMLSKDPRSAAAVLSSAAAPAALNRGVAATNQTLSHPALARPPRPLA